MPLSDGTTDQPLRDLLDGMRIIPAGLDVALTQAIAWRATRPDPKSDLVVRLLVADVRTFVEALQVALNKAEHALEEGN